MSSRLKLAGICFAAAFALAACGGGGGSGTSMMPDPPPAADPEAERSAIQMAINAAGQALAVVTAAGDNATAAEIMAAEEAVARARAAIAAADDLPAAEIAQHNAALGLIDTPLMAARSALDERQRVADVGAARSAALQSYMDADDYATRAEEAARAAEVTAPNTPGAMAVRTAATAARAAANAAKAAHDAIMNGMTKAQADAEKDKAAAELMKAMSQYMTAKAEHDTIITAAATAEDQQRASDVAAARQAAGDAVTYAMKAKNDADTAATAAEAARDAARDAYMKAVAARTDSESAKAEFDKAEAAAMAARMAADAANAAYMAAKSAADGIDDAGTAAAAQAAKMTAEDEQEKAETAKGTAESQRMTAETAKGDAELAAARHVLGLLKSANAVDVMDATPSTDENEARTAAIQAAVAAVNTAARATDNGSGGTTATATWPADTPDDPATTDTNESAMGMLSIAVRPEGSDALTFRREASEDDPATTGVDESMTEPKTATMIDGLGNFTHGYSISDGTTHAIVFTDKQQGEPAVTEVTAIVARELVNDPVTGNTVTDLGIRSGTGYTGVTYYEGTVDDNTDPDTSFTGTLTCPSGTECSVETGADGAITVVGYVFTGNRAAREAVAAAAVAENDNYLAFGVWLQEDGNGDGTADDPAFGAFAGGGATFATPATLTGSATYNGKATGVYTAGRSVDYFQGDATLTANFGTPPETGDDTDLGRVTGMIDNIVAGGNPMSDVIYLDAVDSDTSTDGVQNITAVGEVSGRARMGDAMTNLVTGDVTYTYNGSWSGQFRGPAAADDAEGTDTLPPAVSGTFGVTGTMGEGDAAVTRSYVGAFGARKQ